MQMQVRLGGCNADVMLGKFDLIMGEGEEAPEGALTCGINCALFQDRKTQLSAIRARTDDQKPPAKGSMSLSNSDDA